MTTVRGAPHIRGIVFDTDGVLLDSASLHAAAWKSAFDACLEVLASEGRRQTPFDEDGEYRRLVDGKARFDGARAFLESRGLALPTGKADDPPGCTSVWAVAARKEQEFTQILRTRAVPSFADVIPTLGLLRAEGTKCAAVSASRHAGALLESAGIYGFFEAVVDGEEATRLGLPGKPDPALFLEAVSRLRVRSEHTAVVEDAVAGVEAGRRGGFGLVVGVDRTSDPRRAAVLTDRGADLVVRDLTGLIEDPPGAPS
ncbi:HAD-IA family hydrolase [Streptomyces laculatispora]|uniref:HAD-IA family hydrolase n=1 Tax=Streptomyces laculatispora TaxID=887464 RepID=A0ABY9HYB0_9ACTN|nr:HAD-IA family hydrolase [Streptomyces laculatispora]WLQ39575.1 HAD-IA family hydrolase [Streptomyces laculatispora]